MNRNRAPRRIERRDVEPYRVAERLRAMLGLLPAESVPDELAATFRRPLPPIVQGVDAGAWIAWCLAGLFIFRDRFPSLRIARRESYRVILVLAMLRANGNLSEVSRMMGSSRKVIRENLARAGLLPWALAVVPSGDDDRGTSAI